MVKVKLYQERLIATPEGSIMGSAGGVYDLYYDEAQYVVGMNDGEYMDPPPSFTSPPTLSAYTAADGDLLRCYPGEYEGAAGGTFQWNRDGTPIPGETTNSYAVRAPDVGTSLTCTVTGTNLSGSVEATTDPCVVS